MRCHAAPPFHFTTAENVRAYATPGGSWTILIGAVQIQHAAMHGIGLNGSAILQQAVILAVFIARIVLEIINRRPVIREIRPVVRCPRERLQIKIRHAKRTIPRRIGTGIVVMITEPLRAALVRMAKCPGPVNLPVPCRNNEPPLATMSTPLRSRKGPVMLVLRPMRML